MSCWSKEELEQMLEDVVNELDLSDSAIAEHGPLGTAPALLVGLVLNQKDGTIRNLRAGFVDATPPEQEPGSVCGTCGAPLMYEKGLGYYICPDCPEGVGTYMRLPPPSQPEPEEAEDFGRAESLEAARLICGTLNTQAFVIGTLKARIRSLETAGEILMGEIGMLAEDYPEIANSLPDIIGPFEDVVTGAHKPVARSALPEGDGAGSNA